MVAWTEDMIERVRADNAKGMSNAQIGKAMNLSPASIAGILFRVRRQEAGVPLREHRREAQNQIDTGRADRLLRRFSWETEQ